MNKTRIETNLDNNSYHNLCDGVSKSQLDLINKSPAHYKWALENARKITPAMQKGSLIHTLVLEPDNLTREYLVLPEDMKVRRGKKYEEYIEGNEDKIIITDAQMEEAFAITEAVKNNHVALNLIENADAIESSVFVEDFGGLMLKCRPDIIVGTSIYDLKTTSNASEKSFSQAARTYRYHVQAAYYLDVCREAGLDVDTFGFIVVDTADQPYQCTVFHSLGKESIETGREEYKANLHTLYECMESNEWQGYPTEIDLLEI